MKGSPIALRFKALKTFLACLYSVSHSFRLQNVVFLPVYVHLKSGEVSIFPPTWENLPELSNQTRSLWNTQPFKSFVLSISDLAAPQLHDICRCSVMVLSIREVTGGSGRAVFWPFAEMGVCIVLSDAWM